MLLAIAGQEEKIYVPRAGVFEYPEGKYLKVLFSILTFLQTVVAENVDVEVCIPPLEFIDRLEGHWEVDIVKF